MSDDEWQAHVTREAAKAIGQWLEARGRLLHIEGQEAGNRLTNLSGMFMLAFAAFVLRKRLLRRGGVA